MFTSQIIKTIHLVLKHKWYDMIESGEKPEEYRDGTPYWAKRLLGCPTFVAQPARAGLCVFLPIEEGTTVTFHRGYTSTTMTFEVDSLLYGHGLPQWGAPKERGFIIRLGKRLDHGGY